MSRSRCLRQIYVTIPDVGCKGLCVQSCAMIPLFPVERAAISGAVGQEVSAVMADAHGNCPMLTEGRCSIYAHRPVICRLFGAVPAMRCPHGCKPTLNAAQGHAVMQAVSELEK